jgi:hypothetical protein
MLSLARLPRGSIRATWFGAALEGQASLLAEAAATTTSTLGEDRDSAGAQIRGLRQSVHDRRLAIEVRLADTFMAPMSRSGIRDLASGMVDALDRLVTLGDAVSTLDDPLGQPGFGDLMALLVQTCETIRAGAAELDDASRLRTHADGIRRAVEGGHAIVVVSRQHLVASATDARAVIQWTDAFGAIDESLRAAGRIGRVLDRMARL